METYEISPIAKCHPLRANVHSFCLNQIDSSVFLFVLRNQVVFTAKILQNGKSLRFLLRQSTLLLSRRRIEMLRRDELFIEIQSLLEAACLSSRLFVK